MSVSIETAKLLELARSRDPHDRGHLLEAVLDLCAQTNPQELAATGDLLGSVFASLVEDAERDVRMLLAERIADAEWAPAHLVGMLINDEIDIARPLIRSSPVLNDQDLIRLLGLDSMDHHIEVARRPKLGSAVVEVILEQDEAQVMTALAANDTADISASGMSRLVAASERIASLRSPLARHPRLAPDLAERMYAWVGQSLRTAVGARFRLDTAALDAALNAAVKDARDGGGARINAVLDGVMSEEMETGLVEKLHAAGQLQPGLLLRVLREGRLRLFIAALAKLGRFERSDIRRSIDSDRPEILALACAAVGIDRSVFPAILEMIRKLNGGKPGGGVEGARRAAGAFGPFAPDIAASAFRQTAAKV